MMGSERVWQKRWRVLGGLAGIVLAALALKRAGPQLPGMGGMDSDEAITQLMANATRWNPYSLYFWGQDRLGGWPYGIEWFLHHVFGFGWTYKGLYRVLAVCLLSTVWPLRRLGGWWGWIAGAAVLGLLAIHEPTRRWVLSISQPYAWQMASFFWAWWMLRRLANADQEGVIPFYRIRSARWWRFVFPALFVSLLSLWSSPLSALFLLIAALSETVRIPPDRRTGRLWFRLCGVVVLAVLAELAIRVTDQKYAQFRHWRIYWTDARLDLGHLLENIAAYWNQVRIDPISPVALLPVIALVSWPLASRRLGRATTADDLRFAFACSAMGWINALVTVLSSWGRINGYTARYLSPSWILWTVSSVAMLAALIDSAADLPRRVGRAIVVAGGSAMIVAATLWIPIGERSAAALDRTRVAEQLPLREPDGVLLGCYWGTYSAVDGGAPHALTPIVHHRDMQRTPWTGARLKEVNEAIVAPDSCPPLGTPDSPTPYVYEQGVLLALRTTHWMKQGAIDLSLYDNRSTWLLNDAVSRDGSQVQVTAEAPFSLATSGPSNGQEAFTVRLSHPGRQLLLFFSSRVSLYLHMPQLRAELIRSDGSTKALPVTSGEHYASIPIEDVDTPASVRLIDVAEPDPVARLDGVAVVP
jgi:hypothetical protein